MQCKIKNKEGGAQALRRSEDNCLRNASGSLIWVWLADRPFHMEGAAIMKVLLCASVRGEGTKNFRAAPRVCMVEWVFMGNKTRGIATRE